MLLTHTHPKIKETKKSGLYFFVFLISSKYVERTNWKKENLMRFLFTYNYYTYNKGGATAGFERGRTNTFSKSTLDETAFTSAALRGDNFSFKRIFLNQCEQ